MSDYEPINCDFYDQFEFHALKKTWLRISYLKDNVPGTLFTKIKNLETNSGNEYATLLDDTKLRLDFVKELTPMEKNTNEHGRILDLLDYNNWANDQILACLLDQEVPHSAISLISHIINAHDLWMHRIMGTDVVFEIWQDHSLKDMERMLHDLFIKIIHLLSQNQPDDIIAYQTSSGNKYESTFFEILLHLTNHGTYHRGQIIQTLQASNLKTVATDYILFSRKSRL